MEDIVKNATDVDVEQITESGQQVMNGASDTVKNISDYLNVNTALIWVIAIVAITIVWHVFRKLGKVTLILIIIGIIIAATAGTFIL